VFSTLEWSQNGEGYYCGQRNSARFRAAGVKVQQYIDPLPGEGETGPGWRSSDRSLGSGENISVAPRSPAPGILRSVCGFRNSGELPEAEGFAATYISQS
jgi:hypothetical protein